MEVTEVKRHLDGRIERFACRLVLRRPHLAVLRFDHKEARRAGGLLLPAGSRTFGFFWSRRPYVLYRIVRPNGRLLSHRFDVVEDVRLGAGEVSYTDLVLDIWFDANGTPRVEDEDDVEDHARRGLLSHTQRQRIERVCALLLRRHRAITLEAARLVARAL
jgi:predicted RNA-binding protein associated with RNAse of E/G family